MLRKSARTLVKGVLSFTKVKLLYTRITLNRFTAAFFWAALINFIIGAVLEGISLRDHLDADNIVTTIFQMANLNDSTMGLPILVGNDISVCNGIPGAAGVSCRSMRHIVDPNNISSALVDLDTRSSVRSNCSAILSKRDNLSPVVDSAHDVNGNVVGVTVNGQAVLDMPCVTSFVWLAEMLRDAKREDIATLTFQFWLFTLALVTILNESLPHLGTVLTGHVLLTAWAAFRIHESFKLKAIYERGIVHGPCLHLDPLGDWWDTRLSHAIPMVVMNAVALLVMNGLSIKLFSVYARQTFSRVAATAEIHHLYKLVLFLSVCLHLTGFFAFVSAAIWIDKIAYGPMRQFVNHFPLYLAAFILTAVFVVPWVVLGWTSVRRESRSRLFAFFALSFVMLTIASAMYGSTIYRFVFNGWAFFATLAVTSLVLMLATALVGVLCGRNFGKGLSQYLNVTDALEGENFTPVVFPTDDDKDSLYDAEKGFVVDKYTTRPARKSSLPVSHPSTDGKRPPSSIYDYGSATKIVSPTPVFLREAGSSPVSPFPTAHSRMTSAPSPRTTRYKGSNGAHQRGESQPSYKTPALGYQNSQPTGRHVGLQRTNTTSSANSVTSEFPPVLPPIRTVPPLVHADATVKVGLPANPRSRTPSTTSNPGYF